MTTLEAASSGSRLFFSLNFFIPKNPSLLLTHFFSSFPLLPPLSSFLLISLSSFLNPAFKIPFVSSKTLTLDFLLPNPPSLPALPLPLSGIERSRGGSTRSSGGFTKSNGGCGRSPSEIEKGVDGYPDPRPLPPDRGHRYTFMAKPRLAEDAQVKKTMLRTGSERGRSE